MRTHPCDGGPCAAVPLSVHLTLLVSLVHALAAQQTPQDSPMPGTGPQHSTRMSAAAARRAAPAPPWHAGRSSIAPLQQDQTCSTNPSCSAVAVLAHSHATAGPHDCSAWLLRVALLANSDPAVHASQCCTAGRSAPATQHSPCFGNALTLRPHAHLLQHNGKDNRSSNDGGP